ncbi:hypothetical protein MBT84_48150 [Streptomyces sp. MBT84]|nr:hypothetical protein [Streptomyces sp. MBT84]
MVGNQAAQLCLVRLSVGQFEAYSVGLTGHAQRPGQCVEPATELIGHLPPCFGERLIRQDVHVELVIEDDHGADRCSHLGSMTDDYCLTPAGVRTTGCFYSKRYTK